MVGQYYDILKMADDSSDKTVKISTRSGEIQKDRSERSIEKGKQPAKKGNADEVKSSSKTKTDKNDEVLSILKTRAEQLSTNKKLEAYESRLEQMEKANAEAYEDPYYLDYYDELGGDPNMSESWEDTRSMSEPTCTATLFSGHKRPLDDNNHAGTSVDLDPNSRFACLAKRFKTVEVCDKDIDPVLAANMNELFRKGMEEEQYENMVKDDVYPRPSNCEGLVTVKLNQLVWDIVSPAARSRDKKLQSIETSIVKSASILAKVVDKAAKVENKAQQSGCELGYFIDGCNDALALLGHANRQVNMARRDFLKPELRNEYAHLCTHSLPFTNQLFGDDLSKTAKEIEECSRIGYKLLHGRGSYRGRPPYMHRGRGRGYSFGAASGRGRGTARPGEYNTGPKKPQRRGGVKKM